MTDFEKYKQLLIETNVHFTSDIDQIGISSLFNVGPAIKNDYKNTGKSRREILLTFDDDGKLISFDLGD